MSGFENPKNPGFGVCCNSRKMWRMVWTFD